MLIDQLVYRNIVRKNVNICRSVRFGRSWESVYPLNLYANPLLARKNRVYVKKELKYKLKN